MPSAWSRAYKAGGIAVYRDGRRVEKRENKKRDNKQQTSDWYGRPKKRLAKVGVVRSNNPIPHLTPYFYFELTITRMAEDSEIAIGLAEEYSSLMVMPGTVFDSFGFCNGKIFGGAAGPNGWECGGHTPFQVEDTIGCCLDQAGRNGCREIFFTHNGLYQFGSTLKNVPNFPLYPIVGITGSGAVKANFGEEPFLFRDLRERMLVVQIGLRRE